MSLEGIKSSPGQPGELFIPQETTMTYACIPWLTVSTAARDFQEPGENLLRKSSSSLKQLNFQVAFFVRKYILGSRVRHKERFLVGVERPGNFGGKLP